MRLLTSVFVRGHRALFTAATATLGVGASLLAGDAAEPGNWLLLAGAGLIMGAEDVCREIEADARMLAKATRKEMQQTRADVLATHHPRILGGAILLGMALLVAGAALRAS